MAKNYKAEFRVEIQPCLKFNLDYHDGINRALWDCNEITWYYCIF